LSDGLQVGIARGMEPTVEVAILIDVLGLDWMMNWGRIWMLGGIFDKDGGQKCEVEFQR